MFHNVELLVFFFILVYVIASFIRWLLKLFGYGYPCYINITHNKYGITKCERFYIADDEHLFEILQQLYGKNDG
jgi:hypothetical protein